jgi:hypothetical protein
MNRYYGSGVGRFLSVDPSWGSAHTASPQSFNRFSYVVGDPANVGDPFGLCAVALAGITMGPGSDAAFDQTAQQIGGEVAYPFAGGTVPGGGKQVLFGNVDPINIAAGALGDAAETPGLINVLAYSGGAGELANALLDNPQLAGRIGNIVYISPGSNGTIPNTLHGHVTIVLGTGRNDILATLLTQFPTGDNVTIIHTKCAHTDFACLISHVPSQTLSSLNDGSCAPVKNPVNVIDGKIQSAAGGGGSPGGGFYSWSDEFGWLGVLTQPGEPGAPGLPTICMGFGGCQSQ